MTYNNPVFTEQCKIRGMDFDKLNTGWVEQIPLDKIKSSEDAESIDDDDDGDDDNDINDDDINDLMDNEDKQPVFKFGDTKVKPIDNDKHRPPRSKSTKLSEKPDENAKPMFKRPNDQDKHGSSSFDNKNTDKDEAKPVFKPKTTSASTVDSILDKLDAGLNDANVQAPESKVIADKTTSVTSNSGNSKIKLKLNIKNN